MDIPENLRDVKCNSRQTFCLSIGFLSLIVESISKSVRNENVMLLVDIALSAELKESKIMLR